MKEVNFNQDNDALITPGSRVDFPERVKNRVDGVTDTGRNIRTRVDQALKDSPVNPANENISSGTFVGAVGTALVWAFEDYLPGRIGSSADLVDLEPSDNGVKYIVDSNAVIESQARFRAILDSSTGVTGLWTDDIDIENFEVINKRPGRDTYRYEIVIATQ